MGQFENKFLFYLRDKASGDYFYVNGGIPDLTPTPTYLFSNTYMLQHPQAPDGWADTEITWARSDMYWGLYRNFSTPYKFVGDAATILRYLMLTVGSTAQVELIIKELDSNGGIAYNDYYIGDLDFTKAMPSRDYFEIPIKEQGLRDLFTQNENVTYEIPISANPDYYDAALDGIKLRVNRKYYVETSVFNYTPNTLLIPPIAYLSNDGNFVIGTDQTVEWQNSTPAPTPHSPSAWFFRSVRTQTVEVDYNFNFSLDYSLSNTPFDGQLALTMFVYHDATMGTIANITNLYTSAVLPPGTNIPLTNVSGSLTHTLNEGNVIVVSFLVNNGNPLPVTSGNFINTYGVEIEFKSEFLIPTSGCKVLGEDSVMESVVDKMTNGLYTADLSFWALGGNLIVDSDPITTVYASGDAIRNIKDENGNAIPYVLKTTPKDFFENIMKDWGGGIGIEGNQVVFNRKEYFLDKTNSLLNIGAVSDLEVSFAEEYFNNYIESGNNEQEYDGLNGRDEFINKSKFKTALTKAQTLDLVRPYRHDTYGIETARNDLFDKDTTDNEVDNDIFSWDIDFGTTVVGIGFAPLRAQNNVGGSVAGVLFGDTKYNLGKSPMRVLLRNMPFIQAMLWFEANSFIAFQSTEKNYTLKSTLAPNTDNYEEVGRINAQPLQVNSSGFSDIPYAPLFIPLKFKFKCRVPDNIFTVLNTNSKGYFDFSYNGVALKMFPMRVGLKPMRGMEYEFEGLCHPDVDVNDIRRCLGG